MIEQNKIHCGDALEILKTFPNNSVQVCITSPPYYGLRDYGTGTWINGDPKCSHLRDSKKSEKTITGHKNFDDMLGVGDAIYKNKCLKCGAIREDKQIGLEETPEEFITRLVEVFTEVRRVLKDDGTLWVNIGDSYAGSGKGRNSGGTYDSNSGKLNKNNLGSTIGVLTKMKTSNSIKPKDLIGIPWMLAFALRESGWYLRQDIIWAKPNPMPESVTDRCTKSKEYIFMLSKSPCYFYDNESIKEKCITIDNYIRDRDNTKLNNTPGRTRMAGLTKNNYTIRKQDNTGNPTYTGFNDRYEPIAYRNKRDVWTVSTKPSTIEHFASYPIELIEPCILAGSKIGDIVLDPFFGTGTTGIAAIKHGRKFIGIDLNKNYVKISTKRLNNALSQISMYDIFEQKEGE